MNVPEGDTGSALGPDGRLAVPQLTAGIITPTLQRSRNQYGARVGEPRADSVVEIRLPGRGQLFHRHRPARTTGAADAGGRYRRTKLPQAILSPTPHVSSACLEQSVYRACVVPTAGNSLKLVITSDFHRYVAIGSRAISELAHVVVAPTIRTVGIIEGAAKILARSYRSKDNAWTHRRRSRLARNVTWACLKSLVPQTKLPELVRAPTIELTRVSVNGTNVRFPSRDSIEGNNT